MNEDITLTLDKFDDLGGKYFEQLVAIALDELGYVEGETYLGAWAEKCVPGTWIEADFIVSRKNDKSGDPLNNGRVVLAIGHATSANSAGMKFHRDVEQLLEVKALPNGDEYRVIDILFCCPRESMGGWSKELVAINEAIFDNSLIVWKHDWGRRLLQQVQLHGEKLTQGDNAAKKKKIINLLSKHPAFRRQFEALRNKLCTLLTDSKSHSQIGDIFVEERRQLPARLAMPLLIDKPEKTDFKRGLIQALCLNDLEIDLLYKREMLLRKGSFVPLEKIAKDDGISEAEFVLCWERFTLFRGKLGEISTDFIGDEILEADAKEWRDFVPSETLSYCLRHLTKEKLEDFRKKVSTESPSLMSYIIDMRDLNRIYKTLNNISQMNEQELINFCLEIFTKDNWNGLEMPRLLPFEIAKSSIGTLINGYSYRTIAAETGEAKILKNSPFLTLFAGKEGDLNDPTFRTVLKIVAKRFQKIRDKVIADVDLIVRGFILDRVDSLNKKTESGVLDYFLFSNLQSFASRIDAAISRPKRHSGVPSCLNFFAAGGKNGVNVEIPYVITLKNRKRILIHRVSASEGNAGHKWKEFASKIRSIRYEFSASGHFRAINSLHSTVLIIDGNWTRDAVEDPFALIRALQVAGWDYVVYPDQLNAALAAIENKLKSSPTPEPLNISSAQIIPIPLPEEEGLAMAAETDAPPKLKRANRK